MSKLNITSDITSLGDSVISLQVFSTCFRVMNYSRYVCYEEINNKGLFEIIFVYDVTAFLKSYLESKTSQKCKKIEVSKFVNKLG